MFPFSDVDTITITVNARAYRSYAGVPYYEDGTGIYEINLKDKTVKTLKSLNSSNAMGMGMTVSGSINVNFD